jgi:DNA-binding XRE family transcriptional regulator/quercetin dioxygenase-like cupin family protein
MPSDVPWLGLRLREARVARGMSVRALGEAVGVSASMISQIETGKSRPSVSTLYAITTALEVSVEELFAPIVEGGDTGGVDTGGVDSGGVDSGGVDSDGADLGAESGRSAASARLKSGPLVRPNQRARLTLDSGVTWELLGDLPGRPFDFLRMTYPPGAHSSVTGGLMRHAGCEYGLLLSGELVLTLGFEEFRLRTGDSVSFESSIPHGYRNEGDEPAVGVWFVTEEPHRNIWTAAG